MDAGAVEFVDPFGATDVGRLFAAKRAYAETRLSELRCLLQSTDHPGQQCLDEMLCRFIESKIVIKNMKICHVSLSEVADALASTLTWRAENAVDKHHSCKYCDTNPFAHCFFSVGVDRRGWEVVYSCSGRATMKDPTSVLTHLIAFLETTFSKPNAPSHCCILLDLRGFRLGDIDPRIATRAATMIMAHYPDRIGQVGFLEATWVFSGIWKLLKRIVDPLSQQKVCMLSRGNVIDEYLNKYLTDSQAAFFREMLEIPARPTFEAFSTLTADLRRSLGPCDAFTREIQRSGHERDTQSEDEDGPDLTHCRSDDGDEVFDIDSDGDDNSDVDKAWPASRAMNRSLSFKEELITKLRDRDTDGNDSDVMPTEGDELQRTRRVRRLVTWAAGERRRPVLKDELFQKVQRVLQSRRAAIGLLQETYRIVDQARAMQRSIDRVHQEQHLPKTSDGWLAWLNGPEGLGGVRGLSAADAASGVVHSVLEKFGWSIQSSVIEKFGGSAIQYSRNPSGLESSDANDQSSPGRFRRPPDLDGLRVALLVKLEANGVTVRDEDGFA